MTPITEAQYHEGRKRRFGESNPERVHFAFWEWMVRTCHSACQAREALCVESGSGPDWCFRRFGMSKTRLPDGRVICVGGEHEDFYDSDFCIYNDVVIITPEGEIEFYIYPASDFPPTDSHSATLVDESLYIIGNIGYQGTREFGSTPVHVLDLASMSIRTLLTTGDLPGWISRHTAVFDQTRRTIEVFGGQIAEKSASEEVWQTNIDRFSLDLSSLKWSRIEWNPGVTEWRFNVRDDNGSRKIAAPIERSPIPDAMAAKAIKETRDDDPKQRWRIRWRGVWIDVTNEWDHAFHIVVRGELPRGALEEMILLWTESLTEWRGVKPDVQQIWPPGDESPAL